MTPKKRVPPATPPSATSMSASLEVVDCPRNDAEKLYISLLEGEANGNSSAEPSQTVTYGPADNKINNNNNPEIYNFYNSVIPRLKRKRGHYRNNAIQNRMRAFAKEFYDTGFNYGTRINLEEMKYWIVALELAHDKLTVNQYVHRLCIYGYFYAEGDGRFTFLTDLPSQTRLPLQVLKKQRVRLLPLQRKRIPRRNY